MLVESVTYVPYFEKNNQGEWVKGTHEVTDTLYFNISVAELMENLNLIDGFQDLQSIYGEKRDLTVPETQRVFDFIKTLMILSYGRRMENGGFEKSDAVWLTFTQSAAYSAFVFSLFNPDPIKANNFLTAILPEDLMTTAIAQAQEKETENVELPQPSLQAVPEKSPKDPKNMSREELLEAYKAKSNERIFPDVSNPES